MHFQSAKKWYRIDRNSNFDENLNHATFLSSFRSVKRQATRVRRLYEINSRDLLKCRIIVIDRSSKVPLINVRLDSSVWIIIVRTFSDLFCGLLGRMIVIFSRCKDSMEHKKNYSKFKSRKIKLWFNIWCFSKLQRILLNYLQQTNERLLCDLLNLSIVCDWVIF